LTIDTTVAADRRITISFSHVIKERTTQRLIVEGSATLAAVDRNGKVKRIPPALLEALNLSTT
jgi:acyl-CoA thioester hydrolase